MELVRLTARDFEEAIDFLDLVFSSAYCPMHFAKLLPRCYQPTDESMRCNFAVRENGRIRAIVGLFPAEVQAAGTTLSWAGIGGVSAHPNDRGKGWMKLLMARCIEEMQQDNVDFSFLTGLRQRYQYFGYEKTGGILEYQIQKTNLRHTFQNAAPASDLIFAPFLPSDTAFLEKAKKMHETQPFYCVRPASEFHNFLLSNGMKPWVARRQDGSMAGYLVTNDKQDRITEIFADSVEDFTDMIRQWFEQRGIFAARLSLAPWKTDFARRAGSFAESFQIADCGNWRIYHWDRVTAPLLRIKNEMQPLSDGSLAIGIDGYGTLEIHVAGGQVECLHSTAAPDVQLDPFTAMRILFGQFPAVFVRDLPGSVQNLAASWFPLPLCWLPQDYL
ncbi:MAG: GNAT family N-acetyltransferase [Clostridiaceae bacterium]|nr:GNAT family N-acetyltransferase [Clostridiaceae bacterium]